MASVIYIVLRSSAHGPCQTLGCPFDVRCKQSLISWYVFTLVVGDAAQCKIRICFLGTVCRHLWNVYEYNLAAMPEDAKINSTPSFLIWWHLVVWSINKYWQNRLWQFQLQWMGKSKFKQKAVSTQAVLKKNKMMVRNSKEFCYRSRRASKSVMMIQTIFRSTIWKRREGSVTKSLWKAYWLVSLWHFMVILTLANIM